MILKGGFLVMVTLLLTLPIRSLALHPHPFYSFRHRLAEENVVVSRSPSPSPSQSCSGGGASTSCRLNDITACFVYSPQSGLHEETSLFVQNNGENALRVKIMILPANNTIKEIDLISHQMMKINISSDVDLSSGIVLNTSNGDCAIHAAAPPSENHPHTYRSCTTYITPINGAYLVIVLLIIGGILTFYKLRIRDRHFKGVPYHELEMGDSAALNIDQNWDQDWDDTWGDEKPVKSDAGNHIIVEQSNGPTTKMANASRKIKEWDD